MIPVYIALDRKVSSTYQGRSKTPEAKLTRFQAIEPWACKDVHRSSVAGNSDIEDDDDPPVDHQGTNAVDQFSEQKQEAEFDRDDGAPCQDQSDGDKLLVVERPLDPICGKVQVGDLVQQRLHHVQAVHDGDQDADCADQTADAEQEEGIVDRDLLLHADADIEASRGADQANDQQCHS